MKLYWCDILFGVMSFEAVRAVCCGSFILKVVSGASGCNVSRKYQLSLR